MKAYKWDSINRRREDYVGFDIESKETARPWSGRTQSGYGSRIPTSTMVRYNGKWRRVYVAIYGNAGTAYVGQPGKPWELVIEG